MPTPGSVVPPGPDAASLITAPGSPTQIVLTFDDFAVLVRFGTL